MAGQGTKKVKTPESVGVKALEREATKAGAVTLAFRGEEITVAPDIFDDYELMRLVSQGMPFELVDTVFPDEEQRARVLDTCEKNSRGGVTLSGVVDLVAELMEELGLGK